MSEASQGSSIDPEVEAIKLELDRFCNEIAPSKVVLDVNDYSSRHAQTVLKQYGRFIAQFELYYETIVELCHAINYMEKESWPQHRSVQFLLIVHNLKSLFSSYERLYQGFYEDSLILIRPVYEAFIKVIYISCYPKDPYSIAASPKRVGDGRTLNITNFLSQELKLDWTDYGTLSVMTHANYYSVLHEAVERSKNKKGEAIGLKFQYDKKMLELGISQIIFMYSVYLKVIVEMFVTSTGIVLTTEWLKKGRRLVELAEKSMNFHPKPYWPKVFQDTNDIFSLIREVESGKQVTQTWKEIRTGKQRFAKAS